MPEVNPYYSGRRSTPMSHFVDESLPAELMLKAGISKQEQQNQIQSLVDQAGLWDLDNIGGGDKELVEEMRDKVADFIDTNSSRNLTGSEAQRDVKNFLTKLTTDRGLKQVDANKKKVDEMEAKIAALKAAGHQEFSPSVQAARRTIDEYIKSGTRGGEFGKIDIEKALDLEAKERTYTDNMKPTADEELTYNIANLPKGFIGKKGWKQLLPERIIKRAESVAGNYSLTSEGQQALALYREEVLKYNRDVQLNPDSNEEDRPGLNPNEVSGQDYLTQRLVEAGLEYQQNDAAIGIQRSVFPSGGNGNGNGTTNTPNVVVEPGATIPTNQIKDYAEMQEELANLKKTGASQAKINNLQHKMDNATNYANNTAQGKALRKANEDIISNVGNSTDKDKFLINVNADDISQYTADLQSDNNVRFSNNKYNELYDTEQSSSIFRSKASDSEVSTSINKVSRNLNPIYTAISKYMPGVIKEEVGKNNLEFAENLALGMPYFADYEVDDQTGNISHGIRLLNKSSANDAISSTSPKGDFVSYAEMGVANKDLEFLKSYEHKKGDDLAMRMTQDDAIGGGYTLNPKAGRSHSRYGLPDGIGNNNNNNKDIRNKPWVDYNSNIDAYHYGSLMDKAGSIYMTDNTFQNDATDNIVKNIEEYYGILNKGEGRQAVQTDKIIAPFNKKFNDAVDHTMILGNNLMNLEVVDSSNDDRVHPQSDIKLKRLANAGPGELTISPLLNTYGFEVTIGKDDKSETFTIAPKRVGGRRTGNEKLDSIYEAYRPGIVGQIKAETIFRDQVTNKTNNIDNILGYSNPQFAAIDGEPMSLRLNPEDSEIVGRTKANLFSSERVDMVQGRNPYILGIGGKDITYNQLNDKLNSLSKATTDENQKLKYNQLAKANFMKAASTLFTREESEAAYNYYIDKNSSVSDEVKDNFNDIMQDGLIDPATATNYNELAKYSLIMRM